MAFFKFRARGPQGNEGRNSAVAAAPAESIEAMRRRARHRLVGAAVLVLVGVIGFPLLFDTQPRPVSVDIPIEIPDRTKAKPLALPSAPAPSAASSGNTGSGAAPASGSGGMITESADGTEIPAGKLPPSAPAVEAKSEPASEVKPPPKAEAKPEPKPKPEAKAEVKPKPEAKAEAKPEPKPESKPAPKPAPADDGDRARALLEGKGASAAAAKPAAATAAADESGRFVVQVGAFADADKAKEVRQKLEKAGLKTYTHVAKTTDGERTRVRVGPFGTRAEADRAASKVKGLSLPASVLSL
ncbi:SPOR domain-containing protein [Variovorax sp. J2P1-59]|uniref:SPOR domain-containing protein n=1 Tax=Variovorax flavidus TaxID=3053501 RepID=UPI00257631FD|nr:SPOR domain-containing protein [Variovorax sp. J2P1-59]MDM0074532.1 SPOR domain-containing protein [Variovorax sp. J2P1-59]